MARSTLTALHVLITTDLKRWLMQRARKEERTLAQYCRRVLEDHRARILSETAPETPITPKEE